MTPPNQYVDVCKAYVCGVIVFVTGVNRQAKLHIHQVLLTCYALGSHPLVFDQLCFDFIPWQVPQVLQTQFATL